MNPFNRLRFWSVNPLRLNAYQVTEVPAFNPRTSMVTLANWEQLMDDNQLSWPDPRTVSAVLHLDWVSA